MNEATQELLDKLRQNEADATRLMHTAKLDADLFKYWSDMSKALIVCIRALSE